MLSFKFVIFYKTMKLTRNKRLAVSDEIEFKNYNHLPNEFNNNFNKQFMSLGI